MADNRTETSADADHQRHDDNDQRLRIDSGSAAPAAPHFVASGDRGDRPS